MPDILNTIKELIECVQSIKESSSHFKHLEQEPDAIIKFILDTGIDYDVNGEYTTNEMGMQKIYDKLKDIRERIMVMHREVLKLHFPPQSQQETIKNDMIEKINKCYGYLRAIQLWV
jgi:uncharacterized protein YqgV (UPF0045/DUF77 family)